ncbi:hypothetical protein NDU88_007788, partial [Pleurodeles waltl]
LQRHQRTHTGEKPYRSNDYVNSQLSCIQSHQRITEDDSFTIMWDILRPED